MSDEKATIIAALSVLPTYDSAVLPGVGFVTTCWNCGTVVLNQQSHTQWHAAVAFALSPDDLSASGSPTAEEER